MEQRVQQLRDGAVDLLSGVVRRGDAQVRLSTLELELLAYLAARPGRSVSRQRLLAEVWGYAEGVQSRAVDATVFRLRQKLEADPSEPRHLVTVTGQGYRFVPPRRQEQATNLPASAPPLIGRDELIRILDALAASGAQPITLQGPGGVGKTALARAWAVRHRSDFPGGAWFCALDGVSDRTAIRSAVAHVLHTDEPLRRLAGGGRSLLVLDEAEQVVDALGALLASWSREAPDASFVVTSRIPLGIAGEQVVAVPPLDVEDGERLLVERARGRRPRWKPSAADREALGAIARSLDGLPLALELAAARMRALSPRQVRDRLDERFALLRQGTTTLEATLAWAWERLEPTQQRLLAGAMVFRGGFTTEAAEAVLEADLDAIETLVDHALLQIRTADPVRFDLLENVRAYVYERSGGGSTGIASAHAAWYLEQAERREGPGHVDWMRAERGNLLAAHRHLVDVDPPRAGRLLLAMLHLLFMGPTAGLLALFDRTLVALRDAPPGVRARLYLRRCSVYYNVGEPERARDDIRRGLDLARSAGDAETEARLLARAALWGGVIEEPREATWQRALDLAVEVGDHDARFVLLRGQATDAFVQGRIEDCRQHIEAAVEIARDHAGMEHYEASARADHALACVDLGLHGRAARELDRGADLCRQLGDDPGLAIVEYGRGLLALDRGRLDEARRRLEACRDALEGSTREHYGAYAARALALVSLVRDERDRALREALAAIDALRNQPVVSTCHVLAALAADTPPERAHHLERAVEAADGPLHEALIAAACGEAGARRWVDRYLPVRVLGRLPDKVLFHR